MRLAQKLGSVPATTRPAVSAAGCETVTQNALADFLADRKRQCSGSGDDAVLEQLQSIQARDDLIEHLKDQFDSEIVAVACARARARVEPQTWEAFRLTAYEGRSGDDGGGATRDDQGDGLQGQEPRHGVPPRGDQASSTSLEWLPAPPANSLLRHGRARNRIGSDRERP